MTYEAWRISYQSSEQAARAAYAECVRLRAKIEQMENQEPVAFALYSGWALKATYLKEHEACEQRDRRQLTADLGGSLEAYRVEPLYALPGAQNVPKAVAYLDLGTGGYMDIGTDLTDEALAALPKGRHMLGIVGTYGVDGYVPAQPAPSVPDDVVRDAKRYRLIRRGQHWSVVDGIGDHLRADALDSAVDRALAAAAPKSKP